MKWYIRSIFIWVEETKFRFASTKPVYPVAPFSLTEQAVNNFSCMEWF